MGPYCRIGKSFGWPKEWDDIWVNTKDWTVYAYAAGTASESGDVVSTTP